MSNNKQSSVDWLINVVQSCIAPDYIPQEIVQQAKEMEKQQSENDWWAGFDEGVSGNMVHPSEDCNGYFNETYGDNK